MLSTYSKDSKKYWKTIKLVLPNQKGSSIVHFFGPVKKVMVSGLDAAYLINTFFSNIGEDLAQNIPATDESFWPNKAPCSFVWDYNITRLMTYYTI